MIRLLFFSLLSICLKVSAAASPTAPPTLHCFELFTGEQDLVRATLEAYNNSAIGYVQNSWSLDVSAKIDEFARQLPAGGFVLDAGAGSGRDTISLIQKGLRVEAIDGSKSLAEIASQKIGQKVRVLEFVNLDYSNTFDGIFALASLIHLPPAQLFRSLNLMHKALKPGGILLAGMNYGNNNFVKSDGRYFNAFNEETITYFIKMHTPFEIIKIDTPLVRWANGSVGRALEITLRRRP